MTNIGKSLATAALVMAATGPVTAATMTFDNLPDEGAMLSTYSENGITATALDGVLANLSGPGSLHVDDAGTAMASALRFMTGGLFDAQSFTLTSFGYTFQGKRARLTDNIFVSGFLGGALVGSASYILSDDIGDVQQILLGAAFAGIDRLEIALHYPTIRGVCDAPCGHFDLEEVTLAGVAPAPVPLPATGGILAFVLGGVGLLSLRRRGT